MKRNHFLIGGFLSLLVCTTSQAATVEDHGQNDRVEWEKQVTWSIDGKALDMVHSLDGKYVFILTDQKKVIVYNNQGLSQGAIPVTDGVNHIDIAPQGEMLYLIDDNAHTFSAVSVSFVVDIDITGSPFEGPANAPVTVTVFTDFQCPYCSKLVPLLQKVHENNPDNVKIVLKNLPLRFHRMADPAAKAALAAFEQNKFWEFHDKLFEVNEKLTEGSIVQIAKDLGLDMDKFNKDRVSPKIQMKIQKDMLDAQQAGVTGTPTVFINGRPLRQRSLEGFQSIINEEISKVK